MGESKGVIDFPGVRKFYSEQHLNFANLNAHIKGLDRIVVTSRQNSLSCDCLRNASSGHPDSMFEALCQYLVYSSVRT